jgi:hypothetical protein
MAGLFPAKTSKFKAVKVVLLTFLYTHTHIYTFTHTHTHTHTHAHTHTHTHSSTGLKRRRAGGEESTSYALQDGVILLLQCCYTVVTFLLHCWYTVATMLLQSTYTVLTLLLGSARQPWIETEEHPAHRRGDRRRPTGLLLYNTISITDLYHNLYALSQLPVLLNTSELNTDSHNVTRV